MARYLAVILILSLVITIAARAENPNPSVLMLDFSQNNNTYNWENNYSKHFNLDRLQCDLNINATSLLLKKPYKRWQEQLSATFNAEYRIIDGFSLAPYINHTRNALQSRKVYTSELKLALPFKKIRYAEITPFVSNRAIKRQGESAEGIDRGMGLGISGSSVSLNLLGGNLNSYASYEYYDLNKIPFSDFKFGLNGSRSFRRTDSLSWRVDDQESITRYYDQINSTSMLDDSLIVIRQVKLDRRAEGRAKITLPYEVIMRAGGDMGFLKYLYSHSGSAISLTQADNYSKDRNYDLNFEKTIFDRFKFQSGYKYGWGEEDYRGEVLDQSTEMGEVSFGMTAELSSVDSLYFDGIIGVTSYFALHSSTQNDRDILTKIFNGRFKRVFSDYFNGEIRGAYSSFHQIYISGLNSATNNRNDTYLLQASFNYVPHRRIGINQTIGIQANYIIYDYDPNPIETPNRIFRRASSETKLNLRVSDKFEFIPGYTYRYEDYGKLIYDEDNWQMATGWDRRFHNYNFKVIYRLFGDLRIEPEYAFELKKEYNHVFEPGDSVLQEASITREERLYDTKQIAALRIIWSLGTNEYLDFRYSRREWDVRDRDKDITEFINISVRYMF